MGNLLFFRQKIWRWKNWVPYRELLFYNGLFSKYKGVWVGATEYKELLFSSK